MGWKVQDIAGTSWWMKCRVWEKSRSRGFDTSRGRVWERSRWRRIDTSRERVWEEWRSQGFDTSRDRVWERSRSRGIGTWRGRVWEKLRSRGIKTSHVGGVDLAAMCWLAVDEDACSRDGLALRGRQMMLNGVAKVMAGKSQWLRQDERVFWCVARDEQGYDAERPPSLPTDRGFYNRIPTLVHKVQQMNA